VAGSGTGLCNFVACVDESEFEVGRVSGDVCRDVDVKGLGFCIPAL
jgi:hypothetical protein